MTLCAEVFFCIEELCVGGGGGGGWGVKKKEAREKFRRGGDLDKLDGGQMNQG